MSKAEIERREKLRQEETRRELEKVKKRRIVSDRVEVRARGERVGVSPLSLN